MKPVTVGLIKAIWGRKQPFTAAEIAGQYHLLKREAIANMVSRLAQSKLIRLAGTRDGANEYVPEEFWSRQEVDAAILRAEKELSRLEQRKGKNGKGTLASSEAIRQAATNRRMVSPVITKVDKPQYVTVQPKDFKKIVIPSWQRPEIKEEVNTLIHVLKAGGTIPDPVKLVRCAKGWKGVYADDALLDVDGQQRFWAYWNCELPMPAAIYDVDSEEEAKKLYDIFNTHKQRSPENAVGASTRDIAKILHELAQKPTSPYYGTVNFGRHRNAPYSSSVLVRGMTCAATGILPTGSIGGVLARGDFAIQNEDGRRRAEAFLQIFPLVFPVKFGRPRYLVVMALGRVAYRRWQEKVTLPGPQVYERLKKVKWEGLLPRQGQDTALFLQAMEKKIESIWK